MKFRNIPPYHSSMKVEDYLSSILKLSNLELIDGLHRLSPEQNFESFVYEGTITNGTEVEIVNELPDIPDGRFIVKHSGDPSIVDGDTEWTTDFVYLKNSGAASATVKVIFYKGDVKDGS